MSNEPATAEDTVDQPAEQPEDDYIWRSKQKRIERENRRRKKQNRYLIRYRENIAVGLFVCLMWIGYLYIAVTPMDVLTLFASSSPPTWAVSAVGAGGATGVVFLGVTVLYKALRAHDALQASRRYQGVPLIDAREQDAKELIDR